jgi:NADH dehydrogenase
MKVLILGGRGFIGSNVRNALDARSVEIVIGSRMASCSGTRRIRLQHLLTAQDWEQHINGFDVVINCVGILRERWGETYDAIHHKAPQALALACKAKSIRMIHISALGLTNQAQSRFIRSKYLGEQALLNTGADIVIVRPSLLDGARGFGAKWMRMVAKCPIHPVMKTKGTIAPLQARDLGEAIANIIHLSPKELPNEIELGGSEVFTMSEYLAALRTEYATSKAIVIQLPIWLVRLASHILDVIHISPLSFGHVELMQGYNVPTYNCLPQLLTHAPTTLGGTVPECLKPSLPSHHLSTVKVTLI